MANITTTAPSTRRLLRSFAKEFSDLNGDLYRIVVQGAAKDAHEWTVNNIRSAGRGTWKALSAWTKKRTGRSKPLSTLDLRRLRVRRKGRAATVEFNSPSPDWNLTMHHTGFRVGATNKPLAFGLADGTVARFRRRKPFFVPARRIWPSERTVTIMINNRIKQLKRKLDREFSGAI